MHSVDDDYYLFVVEWYDPLPKIAKQYFLKYFLKSNEVEMIEKNTKKLFLKRCRVDISLPIEEFRIDRRVLILSRDLRILEYGNEETCRKFERVSDEALAMVNPSQIHNGGKIIDYFINMGCNLTDLRIVMCDPSRWQEISTLFSVDSTKLTHFIGTKTFLFRINVSRDNVDVEKEIEKAISLFPVYNESPAIIFSMNKNLFGSIKCLSGNNSNRNRSIIDDSNIACCIIKPHAVMNGNVGEIVDSILANGFDIDQLETFQFDKVTATEFFSVYKGVINEFDELVQHMITGPSIAMRLHAENATEKLSEIAGPWHVKFARELKPNSIRAKYGEDNTRNAVHCTELRGDGGLECQYIFDILYRDHEKKCGSRDIN